MPMVGFLSAQRIAAYGAETIATATASDSERSPEAIQQAITSVYAWHTAMDEYRTSKRSRGYARPESAVGVRAVSMTLKLLTKVRGRLLYQTSGQPVAGVAVSLSIAVGDGNRLTIPVGTLRSDATGYFAFYFCGLSSTSVWTRHPACSYRPRESDSRTSTC